MFVEKILTDHEGRPTPSLFVALLRVEREGDELALPWHVCCHLPHLSADVPRNTANEFPKVVPATHTANGCHREVSRTNSHLDLISHVDVGVGQ